MSRRTFATRLEALERVEAQRQAEQPNREYAAMEERAQRRLWAMNFTAGDYQVVCECCRWHVPGIAPYNTYEALDLNAHRCYICGARTYGMVAPRRTEHLPVADYRCPRCSHTYTGPRYARTPCPACAFAPPPYPGNETEEHSNRCAGAVATSLARAYGPAVAAAWCDVDCAKFAGDLPALYRWWFDEVPRDIYAGLREDVALNHLHVAATYRQPEQTPTMTLCSARWKGKYTPEPWPLEGEDAVEYSRRHEAADHLNRILNGWHLADRSPVIHDGAGALDALDAMLAALDAHPCATA